MKKLCGLLIAISCATLAMEKEKEPASKQQVDPFMLDLKQQALERKFGNDSEELYIQQGLVEMSCPLTPESADPSLTKLLWPKLMISRMHESMRPIIAQASDSSLLFARALAIYLDVLVGLHPNYYRMSAEESVKYQAQRKVDTQRWLQRRITDHWRKQSKLIEKNDPESFENKSFEDLESEKAKYKECLERTERIKSNLKRIIATELALKLHLLSEYEEDCVALRARIAQLSEISTAELG